SEWRVLDGAAESLPAIAGLQIELTLAPIYEGDVAYWQMIDRVRGQGFSLGLVIAGYYQRKLHRMLQFDAVFMRER
ncbi:MAG: FkbM family methyltransferase, partial [Pseudomonadota bacterium]